MESHRINSFGIMQKQPEKNQRPFFIIGCVRSGTTMLRNILRNHPNLACPEETHFYRWGEPFGSPAYTNQYKTALLRKHRELDGVSEIFFDSILENSISRADFMSRYMAEFIRVKKPEAKRWFDKTPQNVYGALLLAADFPGSRFIHIVRNPIEVVSSLRIGKVMKMQNLVASCAYWNESASIMSTLKQRFPKRVFEIKYEDFTADPITGIKAILEFLGEDFDASHFSSVSTQEVSHKEEDLFTPAEIERIENICLKGRLNYGYASLENIQP